MFAFREAELVLLDMQSVPAGQEGWLAFDVTSASNHWLLHPRSNLGIRLYVETEEGEGSAGTTGTVVPSPVSDQARFLPQTALCPRPGSAWWAAGVLAPSSPSW